jgi:LPS-assembly protein
LLLRPRHLLFAGLVSALIPKPGLTAEDWNLCRIPSFNYLDVENISGNETRIEAKTVNGEDDTTIRFNGDVSVLRAEQKVSADNVLYDKSTEKIFASGNVDFATPNIHLQGSSMKIDSRNDRAQLDGAEYELRDRHIHGQADRAERLDKYRSRFSDITYTSCDPEDRVWYLRAEELEIDYETGLGNATHATLYFQEVPFIYLPYFQFPIDDRRQSGLLSVKTGYDELSGRSTRAPVYWNIAPNYDMTITPAWYSKRGLQVNTENRYLFESHRGQLEISYLDDDKTADERWFQQWQHNANLVYGINADVLLSDVSDKDFFYDFTDISPAYNDLRFMDRHFTLSRSGETWQSELFWQNYKTIDKSTAPEDRPYNRLPRLSFDLQPEPWLDQLQTPFNFEWVDFDRDKSVTGNRTDIVTAVNWKSSNSWYFFEPGLQLAFTNYQLEDNSGDNSIRRTLPTLGIDSGLIFEREAGSTDQLLHTLEPRLYYLYTPHKDQDDIPDFDTSVNASTYNNLFSNNRFTGADRIGDANQVTLGLTSRIYNDDSGDELMNARIGQTIYFEDRRVSLDGSRDEASRSDTIAELDLSPTSSWKISARLVYEEEEDKLSDKDLSVGYSNNGFAANLGYYFTRDELEQALVSIVYPVNERWTVVAKYHQSLQYNKTVENLLGINYESCCWGLKILASQTGESFDDFAESTNGIFFEITFKGLTQAGDDIDTQLDNAIPGYIPNF